MSSTPRWEGVSCMGVHLIPEDFSVFVRAVAVLAAFHSVTVALTCALLRAKRPLNAARSKEPIWSWVHQHQLQQDRADAPREPVVFAMPGRSPSFGPIPPRYVFPSGYLNV